MGFRHRLRRLLTKRSRDVARAPRSSRGGIVGRHFFETLEPRQVMTAVAWENFYGNYYAAQVSAASTANFVSAPASGDALTVGLGFFQENAAKYGLSSADLTNANVTSRYTDSDTGITHIYLQQTFNGLPVMDSVADIHLMPDGRVISASSNFVRGLSHPSTITTAIPNISASAAVSTIVAGAGLSQGNGIMLDSASIGADQQTTFTDPDASHDPISAKLVYIASPGGGLELGWQVNVNAIDQGHWYDTVVSASGGRSGQVARVADLVDNASVGPQAFYNVFPRPVQDPLYGNRQIVNGQEDAVASPFGWHDTNFQPGVEFFTTNGNNVNADPFNGAAPNGGPGLNFDFPFLIGGNPAATPPDNAAAATVNLFYWVNLAHDVSYRHGFTEAAGNFQVTNRTGAGIGNDPVNASAQFLTPQPLNNAFMATPPDGQSPTMAMGLFNLVTPFRDSDFDGLIISHEYTHGISNRLTGGPANAFALQALQSGGMGEGWGDWFALISSIKPGDTAATPRTFGQWTFGQPLNGPGLRRQPYSFDMTIDPLTFNNYNGDLVPGLFNSEPHNAGEIWASALWDMTWLLINKYGHSANLYGKGGGENKALDLVFQGMKLQPANPSFTQARDAIVAADLALNAGANYELIWSAFARRGLGVTAITAGANALAVFTSFDPAPAAAHVLGSVFNDANGNKTRDPSEIFIPGITIYNDGNNNSKLDAGEIRTTTNNNGAYSLAFLSSQTVRIRQVLPAGFTQTTPANNAAHQFFINSGQTVAGKNFGDKGLPGQIAGVKFNDLNADGVRQAGEPGISGVMIYVDLNNDSKVSIVEPSAVTDFFGRYTIKNLTPGNGYTVREVAPPGGVQTVPGQFATIPFAHAGIIVQSNKTTGGINFGNSIAEDFGDAPVSFNTGNPARHGILPGLRLGTLIDAETSGHYSADALGDDGNPILVPPPDPIPDPPPVPQNPDDEDGILFVGGGISPGANATIQVTVNTGSNDPGKLHGWIDFNKNGKFDASERVIANKLLTTGAHTLTFAVPASAGIGTTYARFRYGYEQDLGPTGKSIAGEVEDYTVITLPSVPIANPDVFPRPGQPLIKPTSVDYPLDVLANDVSTIFGAARIVEDSFPAVLPSGSTLELAVVNGKQVILYTASPNLPSPTVETFKYRVTDGKTESAEALVTINVSLANPIAFDDTFTIPIPPNTEPIDAFPLPVMDNDQFPIADTQIVDVMDISGNPSTSVIIDPADPTQLLFSAADGFRGTVIYQYRIDDSDSTTDSSIAFVTIQVVDTTNGEPDPTASGYLAELAVSILDPVTGQEIDDVNVGQEFLVRVTSDDLRAGGDEFNRGVESAYLDLLFNSAFMTPVPDANNPFGFDITFDSNPPSPPDPPGPTTYTFDQIATFRNPPGQVLDETGGTHQADLTNPPQGVGPDPVAVFTVRMRATASTAGAQIFVVGDPADIADRTEIILRPEDPDDPNNPDPVRLTEEQTFLRASGPLTILGPGEGQFVNFQNPLDVNVDTFVSAMDALLIINSINAGGSRSLLGGSASISGNAKVDVNMDSQLSPIDALLVMNHINSQMALAAFSASARGEGESATIAAQDDDDAGDELDDSALLGNAASTTASSSQLDAAAADDLFASLDASRTQLRNRFRRR